MMREYELNLIPADIIEHEALRDRIRLWVFVSAGCLALLIAVNILIKMANSSVSKDITELESTGEKLSGEVMEFKQMDMRENKMLAIKEKMRSLSRKGPVIEIFTAIDQAINNNITLTHLEAKYSYPYLSSENDHLPQPSPRRGEGGYFRSGSSAPNLKGEALEENRVIFQGTALSNSDIAFLLTRLSRQPLFRAVNLRYSRTGESERGKTILFEIECRLNETAGR